MKQLKNLALATICAVLVFVISAGGVAHAQSVPTASMPACFVFNTNIRYGSDDAYTGQSYVNQLQSFLSAQGFLDNSYLLVPDILVLVHFLLFKSISQHTAFLRQDL